MPSAADEKLLQQFADTHRQPDRPVQIWLQPAARTPVTPSTRWMHRA
jgi:hypothetical protein